MRLSKAQSFPPAFRMAMLIALMGIIALISCRNALTQLGPGSAVGVSITPYVQNVTTTQVTICWKTKSPAKFKVICISSDGADEQQVETKAQLYHRVTVKGLKPDTRYDYRIIQQGASAILGRGHFRTAPDKMRPFKFVVYGDSRSRPEIHEKVANAIAKESAVEFLVHTGDLVRRGTEYPLWETEFFQPASKLLSRVPIYPCLGNHERNSPYFFDLFVLPGNERFYTFAWSYASFFILDTYFSPCDANSEQYQWLQAQLAKAHAQWKFVVLHSPIYTSGPHGRLNEYGKPRESQIRLGQELLEPLFKKHRITVVFSGHDHLYERSFKDGIYYIVTAGGGAPLYRPTSDPKQNPYSQKLISAYHYCLVTVTRDTVRVQAKDINGQIIDEFVIARGR